MSAALELAGLRTVLETAEGTLAAVDGVDLAIAKGECLVVVGESGCGKSMTALSVLRLLPEVGRIAAGSVRMGADLLALPETAMRTVRGRRVAMIFQEPATALNPVLTVGRQVAEVIERHMPARGNAVRSRVLELLRAVGIPEPERRIGEYPFQLSGGLRQRVMIAAALAVDPEVLIADEPTTAVDVTIQAQILDLLAGLQRERGMALLLITHDLGVVARMADRVAVMYAGEIVEMAPRDAFFRAPQHPYSQKLFAALPSASRRSGSLAQIPGQVPPLTAVFAGCRFAERCEVAFDRCRREVPRLLTLQPGHEVRCHLRETDRAGPRPAVRGAPGVLPSGTAPVLLEANELKVHFPIRRGVLRRAVGHVKAVDGVSLTIREGRTLALVGESGCGKTTLGKAMLQLVPPTGGSVRHLGEELTRLTRRALKRHRARLQIVFQDPYNSLNPRLRVMEIIKEGMRALEAASEETIEPRVDDLLRQVGLAPEMKYRYPHEFSGGQRQRIAIARALSVGPGLIVCDEPTSALDVSVQAQILNLLKDLQDRLGLAYLFITHNLGVVEFLAHEVAVMYLGRIVEHGTVDEVLGDPKHPYTRALLSAVPALDPGEAGRIIRLEGDLPSPANPPAGCHFHPRCPQAIESCAQIYPEPSALSATRTVKCHLYR
jgi:peptide/nickel transport system ATP-binding protein